MFKKIAIYPHISTHFLRRMVLGVVIFFLLGVGWLVYTRFSQHAVTITVNEQSWTVHTNASTVQVVLDEAQIDLDPTDHITPALSAPLKNGMEIKIVRAQQLVLDMDGEISRVYTHEANVLAILEEQAITLNPADELLVDHQRIDASLIPTLHETPQHIRIIRAKHYTVDYHGETIEGTTTALTVGELLNDANLVLYLADEISVPLTTPVQDRMSFQITVSAPVSVKVDGTEWHTRIIGSTVREVLTALDLSLTGQDYTIPPENNSFEDNMTIEIVRVIEIIEVEHHPLAYEIVLVNDAQLGVGDQEVIQAGVDGVEEFRWRVRQENGEEVSRFLQSQLIIQAPVPEIIAVGVANQ